MRKKKIESVFPLMALTIAVFGMVAGCALFSKAMKTFESMTPQEKSLWMMSIYNKEYAEYEAQVAAPEALTEEQKVVLRAKKTGMKKAWPLIKAYNAMVQSGMYSEETQNKAFVAVEELLGIGGHPDG